MRADTELRYLKGVGPRRAEKLSEAGVACVEDLLYVLPFRYEDRRSFARLAELRPGAADCTTIVTVRSSRLIRTRRRVRISRDDTTRTSMVRSRSPVSRSAMVANERRSS